MDYANLDTRERSMVNRKARNLQGRAPDSSSAERHFSVDPNGPASQAGGPLDSTNGRPHLDDV